MVAKADYSQKIVKPIFWNNICLTSILQKSYNKFKMPLPKGVTEKTGASEVLRASASVVQIATGYYLYRPEETRNPTGYP